MNTETEEYALPLKGTKSILLVNPSFPIPTKSKNHKDYLPIGLLKIARWFDNESIENQLVYGKTPVEKIKFRPDEIWVTSLFTYWAEFVKENIEYYRDLFPKARFVVGGIYASLHTDDCYERTKCDFVSRGVHPIADKYYPDYSLLNGDIDFQIVHASRGCVRNCKFCFTHVIEPKYLGKCSMLPEIIESTGQKISTESNALEHYEIKRKGLVFYDNNFLANERIEEILEELVELKRKRKISWCESQSGFDGRILVKSPHLAELLKKANFRSLRIAWDWGYDQRISIRKQLRILHRAGFQKKDIFVFMIYNWDIPFLEMEQKRIQCLKWGVQISDCRYRPINQFHDDYKPRRWGQSPKEYHIHEKTGWYDELVKQFRKNIREQNICVRHGYKLYARPFERKLVPKEIMAEFMKLTKLRDMKKRLKELDVDFWDPKKVRVAPNFDPLTAKPLQSRLSQFH